MGFVDGDGSFYVGVGLSNTNKSGHQVQLRFILPQHFRDRELLIYFIQYFNCGLLAEKSKRSTVE